MSSAGTFYCDNLNAFHYRSDAYIVWLTTSICVPIIVAVGFACNGLNILILCCNHGAKRLPSWNLLLALAICDCLFLLFAAFEIVPSAIVADDFGSSTFFYIYVNCALYCRMLASIFYKTSIIIVLTFNFERYLSVCYPLNAKKICSKRFFNRTAIATAFAISTISSAHWPFCFQISSCFDRSVNYRYAIVQMHSSHLAHYYYRINDYTSMIVFNLLPIALLIILNGRLILTLRKIAAHQHHLQLYTPPVTTSQRGGNESTTRRNISANAMLFAVALMLFVCLGPQIPARFLFDYFGTYHRTTVVYSTITQQLVLLNASLNFCLYCLVSRRYRSLLRLTVKRLFAAMNCNREYKEDIRPVYV